MKLLAIAIALSASAPTPVDAVEGKAPQVPLQLRPKAGIIALVSPSTPAIKDAPFVNPASP